MGSILAELVSPQGFIDIVAHAQSFFPLRTSSVPLCVLATSPLSVRLLVDF